MFVSLSEEGWECVPPKKHPTIWKAAPHTIAKIAILEGYLQSWFQIFGRRAAGRDLLYIDGFAGPGRYTNHPTGSPVAALRSASKAIASCGTVWAAGDAHFAFIEPMSRINAHLAQYIELFHGMPRLRIQVLHSSFVEGIATLKQQRLESLAASSLSLILLVQPEFRSRSSPTS